MQDRQYAILKWNRRKNIETLTDRFKKRKDDKTILETESLFPWQESRAGKERDRSGESRYQKRSGDPLQSEPVPPDVATDENGELNSTNSDPSTGG